MIVHRTCCFFLLFLLAVLCITTEIEAEESILAVPPIENFGRTEHQGGTQTWDVVQDKDGRMLFANNDGMLIYNGSEWSLIPLPNSTILRSIKVAEDGLIYVGGQGELGYFAPDHQGSLKFHDLTGTFSGKMPAFTDVWDIEFHHSALFFRTAEYVFRYAEGHLTTVMAGASHYMGKSGDQLFVQNQVGKLFLWTDREFQPYGISRFESEIKAIHSTQEGFVVFTRLHGILMLKDQEVKTIEHPIVSDLIRDRMYAAIKLQSGGYAIGTTLNGLIVLNAALEIEHHVTKANGFRNNNVLSIFQDSAGSLWLGFDNGIAKLDFASPFRNIVPSRQLEGAAYAAAAHHGQLYLGTSNGLYTCELSESGFLKGNQFKKVANSTGQVWGLDQIGSELWMGHHDGAFLITGDHAERISNSSTWKFTAVGDTAVIAGQYDGLSIYKKEQGEWKQSKVFEDFSESSRILELDGKRLWMSHPYRGVYSFDLSNQSDWKFFGEEQGLPSDLNNYVFSVDRRILIGTTKGVFELGEDNRFHLSSDLHQRLPEGERINYLSYDLNDRLWYASESCLGFLSMGTESDSQIFPEIKPQLVGGFELVYPLNQEGVLIGLENRFLQYATKALDESLLQQAPIIEKMSLTGDRDSLLYQGYGTRTPSTIHFATEENSVTFHFAFPNASTKIHFQTRLKGFEKEWSNASAQSQKSHSNLPPGEYSFEVRALLGAEKYSQIATQSFAIAKPWYLTNAAKFAYLLLTGAFIAILISMQRKRHLNEKQELLQQHKSEVEAKESDLAEGQAEIDKLRREKLEAEVEYKNRELASATLHLVQKNELIYKVQSKLNKLLHEESLDDTFVEQVQQTLSMIKTDADSEEHWVQFAQYFDQVHSDFLKKLRAQFPNLTQNDLKLCAYLRLNLSTKEIATLINISIRGVEGSRYRLRKKLALATEQKLSDFLQQI